MTIVLVLSLLLVPVTVGQGMDAQDGEMVLEIPEQVPDGVLAMVPEQRVNIMFEEMSPEMKNNLPSDQISIVFPRNRQIVISAGHTDNPTLDVTVTETAIRTFMEQEEMPSQDELIKTVNDLMESGDLQYEAHGMVATLATDIMESIIAIQTQDADSNTTGSNTA